MAAKLEWGAKRTCPSCGARFYDMRRDPISCPKCGTGFDPEAVFRPRRTRNTDTAMKATTKAKPPPPPPVEEKAVAEEEEEAVLEADDIATDDDEDDKDLIEDTSDLGEDDSDLPPVARDEDEET